MSSKSRSTKGPFGRQGTKKKQSVAQHRRLIQKLMNELIQIKQELEEKNNDESA